VAAEAITAVSDAYSELKVNVLPSSSTMLVKLNDGTKFARESSMSTPTWCASCRCFTVKPIEGYPEVVGFRWGVAKI
jgi:hypothetical protein